MKDCLDETLPQNDIARSVGNYVQMLDLIPLYAAMRVTKDEAGRSAIAPDMLMALWLMALWLMALWLMALWLMAKIWYRGTASAPERKERVAKALRQHQELAEKRKKRKPGDRETTRVSTAGPAAHFGGPINSIFGAGFRRRAPS